MWVYHDSLAEVITDTISQVLHATPSINSTLRNVRKLLHPQGRLFLQELTPSEYSVFIAFVSC